MDSPPISVVIPCYNAAATLIAAVQSVVAQDVDAEIILVDDGSTDDTASTVRQLLKRFGDRTVAAWQTNKGPAAARNRGIQLARGQYLCFLDADDEYIPGFFSLAKQFLDQNAATVGVECRLVLTHTDRKPEPWQLEAMGATMLGTLMVRSEIVRLMEGFPTDAAFRGEVAGEDGCFRLVLPSFGGIHKLNFAGLSYRLRAGSHADLFLERATVENGKVVFDYQSPEERDGSFAKAIQRYRDAIGSRMIDRACEQIRTEVAAVAHWVAMRSGAARPTEEGTVEVFSLYALAMRWPVMGDVLELSTSSAFCATQRLAAACRASQNGKVVDSAGSETRSLRAVFANIATMPDPAAIRVAESRLPRGGLLTVYSDRELLPQQLELGSSAQWKEQLRLPRLRAWQKIS